MERRGGGGINRLAEIVEPAMTVGSNILAEIPAWAAGMAELNQTGLPSEGMRRLEEVSEMLTYSPRTMEGQAGLQSLTNGVMKVMDTLGVDEAINYLNNTIVPNLQRTFGEEGAREIGSSVMMALPFVRKVPGLSIETVGGFDKRFDPRINERQKLEAMSPVVDQRDVDIAEVDITDLVGLPFLTSMSDRTRAGANLIGINDVEFDVPVNLQGGQDYMFENPGQVWASAKAPSSKILKEAKQIKETTGQDPLLLPWRMAPTGGDFATMTGETMLKYASAAMPKGAKRSLNARLKKMIPGWGGVDSPESIEQFRSLPDKTRKLVKQMMDVEFRDRGGIGVGEARLAVADPDQINAVDQGIMNAGRIFADEDLITTSGHAAYSHGVPGAGVGRITNLKDGATIFDLVPEVMSKQNPRRAMEMKPYSGVLTEELISQVAKKFGISIPAAALLLEQGLVEEDNPV